MAAMGVAGSLNLNELLHAQSSEPSTISPAARYAHLSGGGRQELLGPVKMCIEECGGSVITREYSPDRKLLTFRYEHDGKIVNSSSDSSYSEARDAEGRMLSYRTRNREGAIQQTSYDYDKTGSLLAITNDQNSDRTEFRYHANGSKTSVQTFDPKTVEAMRGTAFAGSSWDAAESGFGVPSGGSVITTYDERENPTEMRIVTADGQLVSQFVRKYDSSGRLVEERPLQQNRAFQFLEQLTPEQQASFPPEQMQGLIKGMNAMERGKLPPETTYKYDAQGRLIRTLERNMFCEQTTTIEYNNQGDIARERRTFKNNSIMPVGASWSFDDEGNPVVSNPNPERTERDYLPPDTDVRYTYQYDSFNNWTEKVVTLDDGSKSTTRRTITYY
jgi:hypothetical protein